MARDNHNKIYLKQITLEYIKEHGGNIISYTDGSIIDNQRGIGIYNNYNNETYNYNIEEPVSIKTIETIAILQTIKIALNHKIRELTLITDSLSTCTSLKNSINNQNTKYFESQIYQIIKRNNMKIKILWIPSHIDIIGNDEADEAAKQGTKTRRKLNIKIPLEDSIKIFKTIMYQNWNSEFLEKTINKGTQHRKNIREKITMKPWFHKINLDASSIKRLTRIRTNHCYDKKYLKLIKKIEDDNCVTCNIKEDARHIIEECKVYDKIREKYKSIKNKKLQEILADKNQEQYIELNEFLREIKSEI